MKQKFIIKNNNINSDLSIKEYANLDRENRTKFKESEQEIFSLVCEETYDNELIMGAIKKGKKSLVSAIRTRNMYPILIHAEKIAASVIKLYDAENNQPVELLFDDKEFFDVVPPA